MKFSLAATSALLLSIAALTNADQYADARKQWCSGLEVPYPTSSVAVVAGSQTKVTVSRVPDAHDKVVSGLDLYAVEKNGKAKYIKNIWSGKYKLDKQASLPDTLPKTLTAGLYYYRVWVSNMVGGMLGPDCIQTSHTFKVTSSSHTNADGSIGYAESLDDSSYYHPEHFRGCYGLTVDYPQEGATYKENDHLRLSASRDTSSQTDSLLKVTLYKGSDEATAVLVDTVWQGKESFVDVFTLKDHLKLPKDKLDYTSNYFYTLEVESSKDTTKSCTFRSNSFKIEKSA
ncbi:hypothetical protein BDF14DRAFT_1802980 [Spinellus fusiger]|nr:hypothetical protein BDF14DRAFT_1802980 [Spinellus fusiger]